MFFPFLVEICLCEWWPRLGVGCSNEAGLMIIGGPGHGRGAERGRGGLPYGGGGKRKIWIASLFRSDRPRSLESSLWAHCSVEQKIIELHFSGMPLNNCWQPANHTNATVSQRFMGPATMHCVFRDPGPFRDPFDFLGSYLLVRFLIFSVLAQIMWRMTIQSVCLQQWVILVLFIIDLSIICIGSLFNQKLGPYWVPISKLSSGPFKFWTQCDGFYDLHSHVPHQTLFPFFGPLPYRRPCK